MMDGLELEVNAHKIVVNCKGENRKVRIHNHSTVKKVFIVYSDFRYNS